MVETTCMFVATTKQLFLAMEERTHHICISGENRYDDVGPLVDCCFMMSCSDSG